MLESVECSRCRGLQVRSAQKEVLVFLDEADPAIPNYIVILGFAG